MAKKISAGVGAAIEDHAFVLGDGTSAVSQPVGRLLRGRGDGST